MIAAVVVGFGLVMMAVERVRPGVMQPGVRGVWARAVAASVVQAGIVQWLAPVWDRYLLGHRPWSAQGLGVIGGAALGYVALTFVYYFWHRARHELPWLWRWLHQLHRAVLLSGLAELFYHWNVRTPRWVGYLIQRPESHRLHHERGRHARNYGDLPLWDMLFGTFENARGEPVECGFERDHELRVAEMLLARDVSAEAAS